MEEYDRLGRAQFLTEVEKLLAVTAGRTPTPKDPLESSLEKLQVKTGFNRKTFLTHVVEKITANNAKVTRLPKSQLTLPKLIAHYEPKLGRAALESCASSVANEHSVVH
ncbi:MAG: hypothetical protein ACLPIX_21205 [Rhodomicrobium sp.]